MRFEIRNLTYGFLKEKNILNNISFSCESTDIIAVVGKNGIGKTTLLKNILGVYKPLSGDILIDGKSIVGIKKVDLFKDISFVPQQSTIYLEYTVFDAVLVGLSKYMSGFNNPTKEDNELVVNLLEKMGIYDLKDRKLYEISGGELQLVLIARALISNPKILILDEPETALDINNQMFIMTLLKKLAESEKLIIIYNTHYIDHALNFSTKTIILKENSYVFGEPTSVITSENLKEALNFDADIFESPNGYRLISPRLTNKCM